MDNYNEEKGRGKYLPLLALGLDIAAVAFCFLGMALIFAGTFGSIVALFCFLLTVASPVYAIITSIIYFCRGNGRKRSVPGIVICVVAILLPIATVIVFVVLFSTGVAVIALM